MKLKNKNLSNIGSLGTTDGFNMAVAHSSTPISAPFGGLSANVEMLIGQSIDKDYLRGGFANLSCQASDNSCRNLRHFDQSLLDWHWQYKNDVRRSQGP